MEPRFNNIGALSFNGQGTRRDFLEARKWYEKGAALGDTMAMSNLGSLYRDGKGVAKDSVEARRWFEMAAKLGDEAAKESLKKLTANTRR